ncbi:MFS transporter [Nocardioides caldifontis]|uniref:MFS transporter n=1 Tax=Nocardioides caldifontis TaxID=2588938 RepID=UPI001EF019C0|nr:MFS transporter [Nocardioides caldifontis]
MPRPEVAVGSRRAWLIWGVALAVYLLAVFHRSSLGVAGLLASERFDISATQLSLFSVLQLFLYAGMQIPVGVLLDRFGARVMLLGGLAMMSAGQLLFAFTTSFPAAVGARAVVGAGDAMVFISVVRLIGLWFHTRQASVVTQVTGPVGQLGAVAAATPLAIALRELGWTTTFAVTSSIGVVLMVVTALTVRSSPYADDGVAEIRLAALARSVRWVWGNPGTRLGMWSHFTGQFSMTVFGLLWGVPFLVEGEGLSTDAASNLLVVMVLSGLVSGVALGSFVARHPFQRSTTVLGVVAAIVVTWTVVLLWPGQAPLWMLVLLVCVMGAGGPASMVGFDLTRSFHPTEATGRANGIVNVGGFAASLVTLLLIGVVLDLQSPDGAHDLGDFRWAMAVQYFVWLLGAVQIVRFRRKAIAHLRRVHPGAVETLKRGEPFVHPGFHEREGV